MIRRRARLAAGLIAVVIVAACGKKGNPLPPLHLQPAKIADIDVRRIDGRVEFRFTVPQANADGSTPSVLDRVEVYGLAQPAASPAPSLAQILEARNRRGGVDIQSDSEPSPAPGTVDRRVAPGDRALVIDRSGTDLSGPDAPTLHYAVVGIVGRSKKGPVAGPFDVPLAGAAPPPTQLAITYDEEQMTLTWRSESATDRFRVYEVGTDGTVIDQPPAGPPLESASFKLPVTFDVKRCFTVRSVQSHDAVTVEGPPAATVCETPTDHFPPAAPAGLVVLPGSDGTVELAWDPVAARDVAGYVVLRRGGSDETLLPLTKRMTDLHYTDTSVIRGTTYVYAIVAEDAHGNASVPSATQSVTVRMP